VKTVPALTETYSASGTFKGFQAKPMSLRPRHSILCLDHFGSMKGYYRQLARGANDYINIQWERSGAISIVQFESSATIVYEQSTANISEAECSGGRTNFTAALQVALQIVSRNPSDYECRILFFTDGNADAPTAQLQRIVNMNIRMDIVGYGSMSQEVLNQLVSCGGTVTNSRTIDEVQEAFCAIAATE
jgi:hypothetical protein